MCSVPPPPPPPSTLPINTTLINTKNNNLSRGNSNLCIWAACNVDLWEVCIKNNICLLEKPFKCKYKNFESIPQVGPTCGLTALSMLTNGDVSANEMLCIAQMEGLSINGEMFSCKAMAMLTQKVLNLAEMENVTYSLRKGDLFDIEVVKELLDGAVLLVPYDADFNHSPCLKQGHKAHWAIVCGVIIGHNPGSDYISDPSNVHVLCKHGKSSHLAAWRLADLDKSNKNLWEFSPKREDDGLLYVLPEGGIGGENGLREQYLIFKGF